MPLDGIDAMPLGGAGLSLLTPFYGRVAPHDNVTLATLAPLGGTPPLTRYRVTGIADNFEPAAARLLRRDRFERLQLRRRTRRRLRDRR